MKQISEINASSNKTLDLVYIGFFTAIMAVCSWISIPSTIPFTLQTMGVFITVCVLGGKRGTIAVLVYLLMGAIGLPVFSGFAGGFGVLLGLTGGYIVGFLFSALVMWGMETVFGKSKIVLTLSMILGLLVCYTLGTIWYMILYAHNSGSIGLSAVLSLCVIPFIIPDLIKIAVALLITTRLRKVRYTI